MTGVALRTLRLRWAQSVVTAIALLFGTAVLLACGSLLETGVRGDVAVTRLGAAPVVVTGDPTRDAGQEGDPAYGERVRLPAQVATVVAGVDGVAGVLPDTTFAVALGTGATLTGHGWSSVAAAGCRLEGSAPAGASQVVLDRRLATSALATSALGADPGSDVGAVVGARRTSWTLTGLADCPASAAPAAYVGDEQAAAHAGHPDRVDFLAVLLADGAAATEVAGRIEAALAGQLPAVAARVLTGGDRGLAEVPQAAGGGVGLSALAGSIGGSVLAVMVFVVAGTTGLALRQRERELSLLRVLGATPRQLHRSVLAETALVTALAAGPGIALGLPLGRWALRLLQDGGAVPPELLLRSTGIPVLAALGAVALVALLASWVAARGPARARPGQALQVAGEPSRRLSRVRLTLGVLVLAGGAALCVVTVSVLEGPTAVATAAPAATVWAIGLALLGPVVVRPLVAVGSAPLRALGALGALAADDVRASGSRAVGVVVPVVLAVGLSTSAVYLQNTSQEASATSAAAQLRADALVTSPTGFAAGVGGEVAQALRAVPGVVAASPVVSSAGYVETPRPTGVAAQWTPGPARQAVAVQGLDGVDGAGVLGPEVLDGDLADLRGDTVALSASAVSSSGYRLGGSVPVRLGDGALEALRLVAVVADVPWAAGPSAYVAADLAAAHTTAGVQAVAVSTDPATGTAALARAVAALAADHPGLALSGRGGAASGGAGAGEASASAVNTWASYLLAALVTGYALVALVNSAVLTGLSRRRELLSTRLLGAGRGALALLVVLQSAVLVAVGAVLGVLVAAATLVPFAWSATSRVLPAGSPALFLLVLAGVAVLSLGAGLLPTLGVLRRRPATVAARLAGA